MAFPYGFTVTVKRPTGSDRYGNPLLPTTFQLEGCAAAPVGSVESLNGQSQVTDSDTLYADYDADIEPGDAVVIPTGTPLRPGTYQVDGNIQRWGNPFTGRKFGSVARLQRVSG